VLTPTKQIKAFFAARSIQQKGSVPS